MFPHHMKKVSMLIRIYLFAGIFLLFVWPLVRFKLEEGDLKYLDDARELIRPERNTLTVSFMDIEEHSTKLATLVQEHYYQ